MNFKIKRLLILTLFLVGIQNVQSFTPLQNGITVHNGNTISPISLDVYYSDASIWQYVGTYHIPAGSYVIINTGTLQYYNYGYSDGYGNINAFFSSSITLY